ncbi:MAG: lamin tail domain-containing protein [Patescibacteria group bacterium]
MKNFLLTFVQFAVGGMAELVTMFFFIKNICISTLQSRSGFVLVYLLIPFALSVGVLGVFFLGQNHIFSLEEKSGGDFLLETSFEASSTEKIQSSSLLGSVTEVFDRALGKNVEKKGVTVVLTTKERVSTSSKSQTASATIAAPLVEVISEKKPVATVIQKVPEKVLEKNETPLVCGTSSLKTAKREIILNELAWMGSVSENGETAVASSRREWLELLNISSQTIGIANWQVLDAEGRFRVAFPAGAKLKPGEFYFLARTGAEKIIEKKPDAFYSAMMTNDGLSLRLVNENCETVDQLLSATKWPAGNSETRQTLERNSDRLGWHTSVSPGGTPKAENSLPLVSVLPATTIGGGGSVQVVSSNTNTNNTSTQTNTATTTTVTSATTTTTANTSSLSHILISEVQIGSSSSTQEEFVELYNPGTSTVNLTDWSIQKKSKTGTSFVTFLPKTVLDGKSIAAGGFFLVAHPSSTFGTSSSSSFLADATTDDGIAAHNTVVLKDPDGGIVDKVGWGEANDFEGSAAAVNLDPDTSIQRKTASGTFSDTDNNDLDFEVVLCPSPRGFTATCVPTATTTTTTSTSTPNATSTVPGSTTSTPELGNGTSTSSIASSTTTSTFPNTSSTSLNHLVISEIQITGGVGETDKDYIKIFNPTANVVDLSGWRLKKRTQSGTESSIKVFASGATILPASIFLWANSNDGFSETIGAQASSTQTLAGDTSVALMDASSTIIDTVAWGSGHVGPFVEGSVFPDNPLVGQLLKRRVVNGVFEDTDSNAEDFLIL